MTNPKNLRACPTNALDSQSAHEGEGLNIAALSTALLDKLAADQIALIEARRRCDQRATEVAMLTLRASAMLLASIPASNMDELQRKAICAAVLDAEDADGWSHARAMVELAVERDTDDLQATVGVD